MTIEQVLQVVQVLGVPSVVAIAAVYGLSKLHTQYAAVQDKRIEDARATAQQLLAALTEVKAQAAVVAGAMDNMADAMREQRLHVESLVADRGMHQRPKLGR
jgi:hypothetical protein